MSLEADYFRECRSPWSPAEIIVSLTSGNEVEVGGRNQWAQSRTQEINFPRSVSFSADYKRRFPLNGLGVWWAGSRRGILLFSFKSRAYHLALMRLDKVTLISINKSCLKVCPMLWDIFIQCLKAVYIFLMCFVRTVKFYETCCVLYDKYNMDFC